MAESASQELRPINYQALDRLVSKIQWNAQERPDSPPLQENRDAPKPSPLTSREAYKRAQEQENKVHEAENSENGTRLSTIRVHDLESQNALLPPDHEFNEAMKRITTRIGDAEKRLQERGLLTRTETVDQYQMHVTVRDIVNAWTYQHGKSAFFEAGFISLLDTYLKEVKHLPGISEDHLAGILAHEASHTDNEAQQSYMNEEYCDAQGVILSAEAGYNPKAMIEIEDFLINLEKGSDFYKDADTAAQAGSKKKHALLPTHPPSENRRVVIINLLKNTEGAIPNQTRDYTLFQRDAVEDVSKRMNNWVNERQKRIFSPTREACLQAIDDAKNETELAEAMMGYKLYRRGELTKVIADNGDFDQTSVLISAVSTELKEQCTKKKESIEFGLDGNRSLNYDIQGYVGDNRNEVYKRSHIPIGGLAREIHEVVDPDVQAKATEALTTMVDDCTKLVPKLRTEYISAPNWKNKRELSPQEREARQDQLDSERKRISEQKSAHVKELYTFLLDNRKSYDLPAILAGDFSSAPELKVRLAAFGITDFNRYLSKLQDTFRSFDVNHSTRDLLGERAARILPDPSVLMIPVEKMSEENIQSLLESTRHYRAALVVSSRFGDRNKVDDLFAKDSFTQTYTDHLKQKISALAHSYSQSPEEQKLLERLFLTGTGIESSNNYSDTDILENQLLTSTEATYGYYGDGAYNLKPFKSTLTPDFLAFRVASCAGGDILESYIMDNSDFTDASSVVWRWRSLGNHLDTLRVYHGEVQYEEVEKWGNKRNFVHLKPRDTLGMVDLIQKRRATIPSKQDAIIEAGWYESYTEATDTSKDVSQRWEQLKIIAERSSFESRHLEHIVLTAGISAEEKALYLRQLAETGKLTYKQIFDAVIIGKPGSTTGSRNILYKEKSFTYKEATDLRTAYEVAKNLLHAIPLSPSFQNIDVSRISQELFDTKLKIALLEQEGGYESPPPRKLPHEAGIALTQTELSGALPLAEQARNKLDFIFDFVKDGGTICLSEQKKDGSFVQNINVSGMEDSGADVNIVRVLRDLGYPSQLVEEKVNELLISQKERYNALEVDKWKSLVAFTKQPYIYFDSQQYNSSFGVDNEILWRIKLGGTDIERKYDPLNIDHALKILDETMMLPPSSYRDFCLGALIDKGSDWTFRKTIVDHPGREYYEKRIAQVAASAFSDIGLRRFEDVRPTNRQLLNSSTANFIPRSERFISDPIGGFYLSGNEAVTAWSKLINSKRGYCIRSVFSHSYRDTLSEQKISALSVELRILSDRTQLLSQMPDSQLKEALTLYAVRSAQDKLTSFTGDERKQLSDRVQGLVRESLKTFASEQGRQGIVDMHLRDEVGVSEGPISSESLRKRFSTRDEYIQFLTEILSSKSAARDTYLVMAVDAYPMKVSDATVIRTLMFANDYSTSNEQVSAQRAGLEFIRSIKSNEKVTEQDVREMILWIIDDKRQVKAVDDFFSNISNDKAGRKLVRGLLEQLQVGPFQEQKEGEERKGIWKITEDIGAEVLTRSLLQLPKSLKRVLVEKLVFQQSTNRQLNVDYQGDSILRRSGMPAILGKLASENMIQRELFGELTFNSILEGGSLESPVKREMFFDLVLGHKGILEESTVNDPSDFRERMKGNFAGSQMHAFIDDVMEIAFRDGKWDKESKDVAKIVSHSFIEAVEPTRRATVLFNLLSELPKIDFNDPDKSKVRSRFLQTALSSIGVLGAKLGQIDELIPKGWGSEISSLKHATKPMSKLIIADIFAQEGLSGEYIIKSSAGAASTACGYVIENPKGEELFAKVLRPEVKMDWQGDFVAVRHMLECLKIAGHLDVETKPIMKQIEILVREELQTQREIDNVVSYSSAESAGELMARGGIRSVEMPKEKIAPTGEPLPHSAESMVILEELLPKSQYIELSKLNAPNGTIAPDLVELKNSLEMNSVYSTIVQDFFHRAFTLGSWHTDLHDGNILVSRDGTQKVTRVVTGEDLVLIDFGQTGKAETEEKKLNAARFFTGLALKDRGLVAQAIHDAMETSIPLADIEKELGFNPFKMQERVTAYMAQHPTAEYLTNFMKASMNVLPYLRRLPVRTQFELITPYIGEEERKKGWIRVQEAVATKNATRLFM